MLAMEQIEIYSWDFMQIGHYIAKLNFIYMSSFSYSENSQHRAILSRILRVYQTTWCRNRREFCLWCHIIAKRISI